MRGTKVVWTTSPVERTAPPRGGPYLERQGGPVRSFCRVFSSPLPRGQGADDGDIDVPLGIEHVRIPSVVGGALRVSRRATKGCFKVTSARVFSDHVYQKSH